MAPGWLERSSEIATSHRPRRLARSIVKRYPDSVYFGWAKKLVEQPSRCDMAISLRERCRCRHEWAKLKAKMTRTEQSEFLCERLRMVRWDALVATEAAVPADRRVSMEGEGRWVLDDLGRRPSSDIDMERLAAGRRTQRTDPGGRPTSRRHPASQRLRVDWMTPRSSRTAALRGGFKRTHVSEVARLIDHPRRDLCKNRHLGSSRRRGRMARSSAGTNRSGSPHRPLGRSSCEQVGPRASPGSGSTSAWPLKSSNVFVDLGDAGDGSSIGMRRIGLRCSSRDFSRAADLK